MPKPIVSQGTVIYNVFHHLGNHPPRIVAEFEDKEAAFADCAERNQDALESGDTINVYTHDVYVQLGNAAQLELLNRLAIAYPKGVTFEMVPFEGNEWAIVCEPNDDGSSSWTESFVIRLPGRIRTTPDDRILHWLKKDGTIDLPTVDELKGMLPCPTL